MSSIDVLRYYLAGAGYSPEHITEIEQSILHGVLVSGMHPDHIASAIQDMLEFEARMAQLTTDAGIAMSDMQAIAQGIEAMAAMPETKPATKAPYYQKNKQQWWR